MINEGGLIKLHYHKHLEVLEELTDTGGVLYYRGTPLIATDKPLFQSVQISKKEHNYLQKLEDGLFVDGTFLDRFSYKDNELYFDDKIVSREYTETEITNMVDSLWSPTPFKTFNKVEVPEVEQSIIDWLQAQPQPKTDTPTDNPSTDNAEEGDKV